MPKSTSINRLGLAPFFSRLITGLTIFAFLASGIGVFVLLFVPVVYLDALVSLVAELVPYTASHFITFFAAWCLVGLALILFLSAMRTRRTAHKSADRFFKGAVSSKAIDGEIAWVYILTNPSMPGLCKIGYTALDPKERARQLDSTGVAQSFIVTWCLRTPFARQIEAQAHEILDDYRTSANREFFAVPVRTARRGVLIARREVLASAKRAGHAIPGGRRSQVRRGMT